MLISSHCLKQRAFWLPLLIFFLIGRGDGDQSASDSIERTIHRIPSISLQSFKARMLLKGPSPMPDTTDPGRMVFMIVSRKEVYIEGFSDTIVFEGQRFERQVITHYRDGVATRYRPEVYWASVSRQSLIEFWSENQATRFLNPLWHCFHWENDPLAEALKKYVKEGKVEYLGVDSSFPSPAIGLQVRTDERGGVAKFWFDETTGHLRRMHRNWRPADADASAPFDLTVDVLQYSSETGRPFPKTVRMTTNYPSKSRKVTVRECQVQMFESLPPDYLMNFTLPEGTRIVNSST